MDVRTVACGVCPKEGGGGGENHVLVESKKGLFFFFFGGDPYNSTHAPAYTHTNTQHTHTIQRVGLALGWVGGQKTGQITPVHTHTRVVVVVGTNRPKW